MLQEKDDIKPAFYNRNTGSPKTVECIRVDSGGDEEEALHTSKSSIGGQLGT
jgi:hypothetical protein